MTELESATVTTMKMSSRAPSRTLLVRSGLISRAQLFTPEDSQNCTAAAEHWFYRGPELDYKQQKTIQEARTKIEYAVPDLQSRLEQVQSQEPQMNL